jgi:hypothetical protein
VSAREKAIAGILLQMKERLSLKDLTDEQWDIIQHYLLCAYIDGKDYAFSAYVLKDKTAE